MLRSSSCAQSASTDSAATEDRFLAHMRARDLAADGRKAGLAADRTPDDIVDTISELAGRDGWTAGLVRTLRKLVRQVPVRSWKTGSCDPVVSYPIRDLGGDLNLSTKSVRNHLLKLTSLGALWFERTPTREGEIGDRYHVDLAPMIVLDAPVQRRVRELREERNRQFRLRHWVGALRTRFRSIVAGLRPEPAGSDEAAAFASELDALFPAGFNFKRAPSAVLAPLADSLTDLIERFEEWSFPYLRQLPENPFAGRVRNR